VTNIVYPAGFSGFWTGTVDPGAASNVVVTFSPTNSGNYGGTISVQADATSGNGLIACSGTGLTAQAGYDLWAAGITNLQTNYNDSASNDGYANLLKYATGSSPTGSDTIARMDSTRTGAALVLKFNHSTNATDVTLWVEASASLTDPAAWTPIATNSAGSWGGATNVTENTAVSPATVQVSDPTPGPVRMLRLRVTRP
jgi:hypothetical protein